MNLECPYCKAKLIEGFIDSGKYFFKWHNKNLNLLEKLTVFGGEILSGNPEFGLIKSYRCKNCNKIIIDLDEINE